MGVDEEFAGSQIPKHPGRPAVVPVLYFPFVRCYNAGYIRLQEADPMSENQFSVEQQLLRALQNGAGLHRLYNKPTELLGHDSHVTTGEISEALWALVRQGLAYTSTLQVIRLPVGVHG